MRYAGYIRVSSEDQLDNYSLDAQRRAISEWVARQNGDLQGQIARWYSDEGHTATTDNRPALRQLRLDAKRGMFDAVVVHKWDRLARNREQAIILKALLRRDLGVKVFSVSEPSEDADGAMGMLVEGMIELVAEWYSKNLSAEFKKGKHEKAKQGKFNGSIPPFGYDKGEDGALVVNEREAEGVILAFTTYKGGEHYDLDIARVLNQAEYRQKSGKPFTREAVRYMLQNRTYLGLIGYKPCVKNPDGSRKKNVPITWDELAQAAKILSNFKQAWEEAEGNLRKKLLRLVAEKVFVQGDYVTAVTLRPSYHVLVAQR